LGGFPLKDLSPIRAEELVEADKKGFALNGGV